MIVSANCNGSMTVSFVLDGEMNEYLSKIARMIEVRVNEIQL